MYLILYFIFVNVLLFSNKQITYLLLLKHHVASVKYTTLISFEHWIQSFVLQIGIHGSIKTNRRSLIHKKWHQSLCRSNGYHSSGPMRHNWHKYGSGTAWLQRGIQKMSNTGVYVYWIKRVEARHSCKENDKLAPLLPQECIPTEISLAPAVRYSILYLDLVDLTNFWVWQDLDCIKYTSIISAFSILPLVIEEIIEVTYIIMSFSMWKYIPCDAWLHFLFCWVSKLSC